jgi:hypothetical protein
MYNPFDLIPKNFDPNLRFILIILVSVQFIAFLVLLAYLINQYMKVKSGINSTEEEIEENATKEKNHAKSQ